MPLITSIVSSFDATLPQALIAQVASGASHRYQASAISGSSGDSITQWNDQIATSHMLQSNVSGATSPTLGLSSGEKYLSFDGVSNGVKSGTWNSTKTLLMVVRPTVAVNLSTNLSYHGNVVTSRHVTNAANLLLTGASSVTGGANTLPSNTWKIVTFVINGTSSYARIGANQSGNPAAGASGLASYTGLGMEGSGRCKADYAELIAWERVLTSNEITGTIAAMAARYGGTLGVTTT